MQSSFFTFQAKAATLEDKTLTLVNNALRDKTFYSFNVAYGAITKLPLNSQGSYLTKLAPLEKQVRTKEIDTILRKIDSFYSTKNMRTYDEVLYTLIPKISNIVDRDYLTSELGTWGTIFMEKEQPEYPKATDAILKVWNSLDKGDFFQASDNIEDANLLIDAVTHKENNKYLNELLNECKDVLTNKSNIISVSIIEQTFDDNISNQKLDLLVNNTKTDLDYLKYLGYKLDFTAFDKSKRNVTSKIFFTNSNGTNDSGNLRNSIPVGDYLIQTIISKGDTIVVAKGNIRIRNLDILASNISSYKLQNITNTNNPFIQNSNTIVVGESAIISSLTLSNGKVNEDVYKDIEVTSSDQSIISVTKKDKAYTLKGETSGNVILTLSFGNLEKDITLQVTESKRVLSSLSLNNKNLDLVKNSSISVIVKAFDQFGDPSVADFSIDAPNILKLEKALIPDSYGATSVTIQALEGNTSSYITFHTLSNKPLGFIKVITSEVVNFPKAKRLLRIADNSSNKTNVLTITDDETPINIYNLVQYNSEGIFNGLLDLSNYTLSFDDKIIKCYLDTNDKKRLIIEPIAEGTSNLSVIDSTGTTVDTISIQVKINKFKISSVDWKDISSINYIIKINYSKVLNISQSSDDDIVSGVILNKPTIYKVRISKSNGNLYIDRDNDGIYTSGDIILGTLTLKWNASDQSSSGQMYNPYNGVELISSSEGSLTFEIIKNNKTLSSKVISISIE